MKRGQRVLQLVLILLLVVTVAGKPFVLPAYADSEVNYIDKATNGLVHIIAFLNDGTGYYNGTGFGVGKSGEPTDTFVTNWHVVYDDTAGTLCNEIYILLDDTETLTADLLVPVEVLYTTEGAPDFAIVKAERVITERIALPIQNSRSLSRGDTVYTLGFPGSSERQSGGRKLANPESATIKDGTVSRFMRFASRGDTWVVEHSANFSFGNSGGPLITSDGIAVGINTYSSMDPVTLYDERGNAVEYGISGTTAEYHFSVFTDYAMNALTLLDIPFDSDWGDTETKETAKPSEDPGTTEAPKPTEGPEETESPIIDPDDQLPKWVIPVSIAAAAVVVAVIAALLLLRKKKPAAVSGEGDTEMLRLQCVSGAFASRRFSISNPMRLGRDPASNDLIFPDEKRMVSRVHCRLVKENGALYLEDLGSTRGTYCNGARLQAGQKVRLKEGDGFYLGEPSESFQIVLSSQASSTAAASAARR